MIRIVYSLRVRFYIFLLKIIRIINNVMYNFMIGPLDRCWNRVDRRARKLLDEWHDIT